MAPTQELRDLPVVLIEPNLSQPRRYFDEAGGRSGLEAQIAAGQMDLDIPQVAADMPLTG
jgi:hypothetical protein